MFSVRVARRFECDARPLLKKYASPRSELAELARQLAENPSLGIALGHNCYKIRLSIKSKGKGKSGGARIITYVVVEDKEVILLTIFDKQIKADLSANELKAILDSLES